MQNPGHMHWEAGKHIVHYLKGMCKYALTLLIWTRILLPMTMLTKFCSYTVTWYQIMLPHLGMLIAWELKKQSIVALLSTEAEYIAMMNALKDIIWLQNLHAEIYAPVLNPTSLHCDNQDTIALMLDNKFHPQTKYINICYHFIQEAIEDDIVLPIYWHLPRHFHAWDYLSL